MLIKMLKTAAGPEGAFHEGHEYPVDESIGKDFITAGAAVGVKSSDVETAESPAAPKAADKQGVSATVETGDVQQAQSEPTEPTKPNQKGRRAK